MNAHAETIQPRLRARHQAGLRTSGLLADASVAWGEAEVAGLRLSQVGFGSLAIAHYFGGGQRVAMITVRPIPSLLSTGCEEAGQG